MITLHHCAGTRSMRILWLLEEMDEPFTLVTHAFDKSLRDPDYLTRSPAGRVPAIELDGDYYFESGAIIEILCERFPQRGLGRPPGDLDRPEWLVWLNFAETITQSAAALTMHHITLRDPEMRSPTVMRLEAARLTRLYAAIEGRLSTPVENRDYLLTSGFSAADIAVGQAVWLARFFAPLDGFPETEAWFERITSRESFARAAPQPGASIYLQDFYPPPEAPD